MISILQNGTRLPFENLPEDIRTALLPYKLKLEAKTLTKSSTVDRIDEATWLVKVRENGAFKSYYLVDENIEPAKTEFTETSRDGMDLYIDEVTGFNTVEQCDVHQYTPVATYLAKHPELAGVIEKIRRGEESPDYTHTPSKTTYYVGSLTLTWRRV